jgi:hypothetical protein
VCFIQQSCDEDRPSSLTGEILRSLLGTGCWAKAHSEALGGAHKPGHFRPVLLGAEIFWPKGRIKPMKFGIFFSISRISFLVTFLA